MKPINEIQKIISENPLLKEFIIGVDNESLAILCYVLKKFKVITVNNAMRLRVKQFQIKKYCFSRELNTEDERFTCYLLTRCLTRQNLKINSFLGSALTLQLIKQYESLLDLADWEEFIPKETKELLGGVEREINLIKEQYETFSEYKNAHKTSKMLSPINKDNVTKKDIPILVEKYGRVLDKLKDLAQIGFSFDNYRETLVGQEKIQANLIIENFSLDEIKTLNKKSWVLYLNNMNNDMGIINMEIEQNDKTNIIAGRY